MYVGAAKDDRVGVREPLEQVFDIDGNRFVREARRVATASANAFVRPVAE